MPITKLTLGLGLFFAGAAMVQAESYKIRPGDTISEIAAQFHLKSRDILRANGLTSESRLQVGHVLYIPSAAKSNDRHRTASVPSGSGFYVVRNGEHDWTIAKRLGITPSQLRRLNPDVNWNAVQIGQRLRVPTNGVTSRSNPTAPAKRTMSSAIVASGAYKIREGDNDWIIARRLDTTPRVLRSLNPSVNWSHVQIGRIIRIPGATQSAAPSVAVARLRTRYAVVSRDDATIRRSASTAAEAVTTVPSGTRVVVLDRDGAWYKLRFPKGTEGWMRGDLLKAAEAPRDLVVAERARRRKDQVASRPAVVRKRSSQTVARHADSKPIAEVVQTTTYTMRSDSSDSRSRILSRANSMRGVRYRWGASSRSATDCSGFTSQVFKSTGYRLPRTSSEQSRAGVPVPRQNLQPGDLVFFRTVRGTRVSHVGIYIGNNRFIHASSGGGKVQVNSLGDGYYNRRFVTARRVVKPSKHASAKKPAAEKFPETVPPIDAHPAN